MIDSGGSARVGRMSVLLGMTFNADTATVCAPAAQQLWIPEWGLSHESNYQPPETGSGSSHASGSLQHKAPRQVQGRHRRSRATSPMPKTVSFATRGM